VYHSLWLFILDVMRPSLLMLLTVLRLKSSSLSMCVVVNRHVNWAGTLLGSDTADLEPCWMFYFIDGEWKSVHSLSVITMIISGVVHIYSTLRAGGLEECYMHYTCVRERGCLCWCYIMLKSHSSEMDFHWELNMPLKSICIIQSALHHVLAKSCKPTLPRRQPHRRSGLATLPSVGAVP